MGGLVAMTMVTMLGVSFIRVKLKSEEETPKKSIFDNIGGFDAENTPIANSDADLSFRILERRLRCVYTPYATLRHIGHLSIKNLKSKQKKTKDKADIFIRVFSSFTEPDPLPWFPKLSAGKEITKYMLYFIFSMDISWSHRKHQPLCKQFLFHVFYASYMAFYSC